MSDAPKGKPLEFVIHRGQLMDAKLVPWLGYPPYYEEEYRTLRNFHVARMPLWYWWCEVRNWCYFRTCRCWVCGKGFGLTQKPYSGYYVPRKYMSHVECVTEGGGYRVHPDLAREITAQEIEVAALKERIRDSSPHCHEKDCKEEPTETCEACCQRFCHRHIASITWHGGDHASLCLDCVNGDRETPLQSSW